VEAIGEGKGPSQKNKPALNLILLMAILSGLLVGIIKREGC
jgi:hypothetical protein